MLKLDIAEVEEELEMIKKSRKGIFAINRIIIGTLFLFHMHKQGLKLIVRLVHKVPSVRENDYNDG